MNRSLTLLIAASAVVATPLPALAQAWPATVVASAPQIASRTQAAATPRHRVMPTLPDELLQTSHRPLKLTARIDPDEIPDVDLRAKDEWLDDQGLRVTPKRIAFKRRF